MILNINFEQLIDLSLYEIDMFFSQGIPIKFVYNLGLLLKIMKTVSRDEIVISTIKFSIYLTKT